MPRSLDGDGRRRVAIVDDDDVYRTGLAVLLDASPDIAVVADLTHAEALERSDVWAGVDVAVVDAADSRRADDQFPGVAVVEAIRDIRSSREVTVIVVTGQFFDDAVRRRMREARADFFYHRDDVADLRALYDAVLRPDSARRPVPAPTDPEAQFRHGVTCHTRVNRAVVYALHRRLDQALAERADPRSRRWLRLRDEFNKEAGLTPVTTDGRHPDRRQDVPSLPQIARFLNWATKVKEHGPRRTAEPAED